MKVNEFVLSGKIDKVIFKNNQVVKVKLLQDGSGRKITLTCFNTDLFEKINEGVEAKYLCNCYDTYYKDRNNNDIFGTCIQFSQMS